MKLILPSAGYATRLWPLTKDKPKCLLEIGGTPIIEILIHKIEELGDAIDGIYVVTNAKFYDILFRWSKDFSSKIPIEVLNDGTTSNETRLGCIGDIQFVIDQKKINEEIMIINSDSLFDFGLKEIYNFYREKNAPVVLIYDVGSKEMAKRLGVVTLDERGVINYFREKPEEPPSTLCSVATYIYPRETVKLIKRYLDEGNNPDAPGRFVEWLYRVQPVYGYVYEGKYYDIGTLETLEEARKEWEKKFGREK